jgi:hypothetical protein
MEENKAGKCNAANVAEQPPNECPATTKVREEKPLL